MKSADYTDDAIAQAMGIGPFVPIGISPVIRIIFKPSFHPEVCITLERSKIQLVALRSMLWHEPVPCRLPEFADLATISPNRFAEIASAFSAIAESHGASKWVTIDGMSVSAIQIDGSSRWQYNDHPHGAEKEFFSQLLSFSHSISSGVSLRNRIAVCSSYVGSKIALEVEPPLPDTRRILVVGNPEERETYFDSLRRAVSQHDSKDTP